MKIRKSPRPTPVKATFSDKPSKALATRPTVEKGTVTKEGRELSTDVKGRGGELGPTRNEREAAAQRDAKGQKKGGTVIVSNGSDGGLTMEEKRAYNREQGTDYYDVSASPKVLSGLLKANDALRVMVEGGIEAALAEMKLRPLVLSMGNKRKREKLADGGSIQRRLAGTGFDGKNNKGFVKGRKNLPVNQNSQEQGGGERGSATRQDRPRALSGGKASPPQLGDKAKAPALPGKPAPLQLGDGKPVTPSRPRSAGSSGFAADAPAPTFTDAPGTASAAAEKVPFIPLAMDYVAGFKSQAKLKRESEERLKNDPSGKMSEETKLSLKLKFSDVVSALKKRNFKAALNLAMTDPDQWQSAAQQQRAMKAVETFVMK